MFKKFSKKIISIALAVAMMVGVAVPTVVEAGNSASTTTEKVYLAHANDAFVQAQMVNNFGGATKVSPYNTYADSENGTRGAYLAANPAAVGLPFIHVYNEKGIDLTNTTGTFYVNLYWTGNAAAGDQLVMGFSSDNGVSNFSNDPQWPLDLKTALDAGSIQQGWNVIPLPASDHLGATGKATNFRIYNANADETTGLACGAVYTVDKNDPSKKYYIVNAQDEIVNSTLLNANGSMSTTYTNYDDGTKGAYVCAGPTVNHAIPFLNIAYATPVSLADTTGKVTFNVYHTATSETADDVVVCRLTYDGVDTPVDQSVLVNTLDNGWNAITVDADKTKALKGVTVYASAMAGTTALAAGSVYVTKEVSVNPGPGTSTEPGASTKPGTSTKPENKPAEVKYANVYLISATKGEKLYELEAGFLNDGLKMKAPYNAYGDKSHGAYKAVTPTGSRPGIMYDIIVCQTWDSGLSLDKYTGKVTANIYYKGTQAGGPIVFAFWNGDGEYVEQLISTDNLKQGWNEVTIDLAQMIKDKKITLDKLTKFYAYTVKMDKCKDLAIGSVYIQKPESALADDEQKNKKTYILEALSKNETSPFECMQYFDAGFNSYGDKTRGAYVRKGAINSDFWFAKLLNNMDLSKEQYVAINFYVDDPSKFTSMFIEMSSSGTWDKEERNWAISSFNTTLKKGWNTIMLDINHKLGNTAEGTIGYALSDIGGTFDASSVSFIRVYGTYAGETSAVGAIYLSSSSAPDTGDYNLPVLLIATMSIALVGIAYSSYDIFGKKRRK